jgi:alpha-glucosidase
MQDWTFDGKKTAEGFDGCGNIDRKVAKARAAGAKIGGVWCQDWCGCRCTQFGYQVMWNWQYDEKQYPNLPEKIKEWDAQGIKFLGYINPFIALEKNIYQEAKEKGYCVKDKEGKDYLVTITTFPAAMVDFTNPAAYEWYKNLIKENMIGIGMGGWMADFGEYLPIDAVLYSGEDAAVLHNRWPAIWAKMNREAIEETEKLGEVFFFTRAGHTDTIKYSTMMWTGDQHVDWSVDDGLPSVIPATLSLAMSGYGITHSDVGGYTTIMNMTRSKELLLRWEEMNVFSPLFRSHEGNQPSRNVQFDGDEELLKQLARCTKMHVALKDYIKKYVAQQTAMGTPVMRPLFYHYDEERAYTEKKEYLLGRDILVAPVYKEGDVKRTCYLPEDTWVHLFSGKEYTGGQVTVDAPIGQPPVFIRKNSEDFDMIKKIAE